MKNILLLIIILLCSFKTNDKKISCTELDIFLIADVSASVDSNLDFIADAMRAFVDKFELSDNGIRIGIISFEVEAFLYNKLISDKNQLFNSIEIIRNYHDGTITNISNALMLASDEFLNNGRSSAMKIIVIITDGDPTDESSSILVSKQLKELLMIGICGVLVNNNTKKPEFLKSISSDYCYVESNYSSLVEELKKLDICL